jgi:hypothetical protein
MHNKHKQHKLIDDEQHDEHKMQNKLQNKMHYDEQKKSTFGACNVNTRKISK